MLLARIVARMGRYRHILPTKCNNIILLHASNVGTTLLFCYCIVMYHIQCLLLWWHKDAYWSQMRCVPGPRNNANQLLPPCLRRQVTFLLRPIPGSWSQWSTKYYILQSSKWKLQKAPTNFSLQCCATQRLSCFLHILWHAFLYLSPGGCDDCVGKSIGPTLD